MAQKMLSLQAVASRPRPLSYVPPLGCTDRDASKRSNAKQSSWQSNLMLGSAVAAVTFASLTRVRPYFSAYNVLFCTAGIIIFDTQNACTCRL